MYEKHNSSAKFALLLPLYFQFLKAIILVSVITSIKLIISCKTLTNQRKHYQGLKKHNLKQPFMKFRSVGRIQK
jgi:hypothetical protein